MFPAALITFREVFETTLTVGIMLSYLSKTNQSFFKKYVWFGTLGGVLISLTLGVLLKIFFGGLPQGRGEQIYEGVLMFVTALLLTWMILWIHRQKEHVKKLTQKISVHVKNKYGFGILIISLVSVAREGTEAVLYLQAASLAGSHNQMVGAFFGILVALFIGILVFSFAVHAKLKTIFSVTTVFLLLFAAGLVASGVHEFQEASIIPLFKFDPLFNISKYLSDESGLGGVLHSLFGYSSKPSVIEISSYIFYIIFIVGFERVTTKLLLKNKNLQDK